MTFLILGLESYIPQNKKKTVLWENIRTFFRKDFLGKNIRNLFREKFWGVGSESALGSPIIHYAAIALIINLHSPAGFFLLKYSPILSEKHCNDIIALT